MLKTLARPGYNCTPNKLLPVRFNTHLVRILVVSTRRRRFPNDAFVAEFAFCAVAADCTTGFFFLKKVGRPFPESSMHLSPLLQKPRHVQNISSILVRTGVLCTRETVSRRTGRTVSSSWSSYVVQIICLNKIQARL